MMRYTVMTLALGAMLGSAGIASAQFQTQPYSYTPNQTMPNYPTNPYGQSVMPNIYNPVNQPLSPYLNLLRGGNAGVNYYYGVRPGTAGGSDSTPRAPIPMPSGSPRPGPAAPGAPPSGARRPSDRDD